MKKRHITKKPHDIQVRVNHYTATNQGNFESIVTLNVKLYEYMVRINRELIGALIPLLTEGKVLIKFDTYSERIELIDQSDKLNRPQAMQLVDEFIAEADRMGVRLFAKSTQGFVVSDGLKRRK
jgi:hypothetical protein